MYSYTSVECAVVLITTCIHVYTEWSNALMQCTNLPFVGGMYNVLYFRNLTQGPHNYTVIARDQDGLVSRSDVHFEGQFLC